MPKKAKAKKKAYKKKRIDLDKQQLACIEPVVPEAVSGSLAINIHPRSVSRFMYFNASLTPTPLINYAKFKDIYDEWRPYFVTIQYTTLMNTSYLASSGNPGTTFMNQAVLVFDPDNTSFANVRDMMAHKGSRVVNLNNNWKATFKIPQYSNDASTRGYSNLQAEQSDDRQVGIIALKSITNMTPPSTSQPIGIIKVKLYCLMKGRNDSNITAYYGVDSLGGTMLTQPIFPPVSASVHEDGLNDDVTV